MSDDRRPSWNAAAGYAVLRIILGLDFAVHGGGRLFVGGLARFVTMTMQQFAASPLPDWSVRVFATVTPFVELGLGILLMLGLFTPLALLVGSCQMAALIFGMSLLEKWDVVGTQLIYVLFLAIMLYRLGDNAWSLDRVLHKK